MEWNRLRHAFGSHSPQDVACVDIWIKTGANRFCQVHARQASEKRGCWNPTVEATPPHLSIVKCFILKKMLKDLSDLTGSALMPLFACEGSTQEMSWSIACRHRVDAPRCHTPMFLLAHSLPASASSWARQHQRLVWRLNKMPSEKNCCCTVYVPGTWQENRNTSS